MGYHRSLDMTESSYWSYTPGSSGRSSYPPKFGSLSGLPPQPVLHSGPNRPPKRRYHIRAPHSRSLPRRPAGSWLPHSDIRLLPAEPSSPVRKRSTNKSAVATLRHYSLVRLPLLHTTWVSGGGLIGPGAADAPLATAPQRSVAITTEASSMYSRLINLTSSHKGGTRQPRLNQLTLPR
jgi:hypothetical protein